MSLRMKCYFIRHGKTEGNLSKRYIGRTDEPLCREGVEEITTRSKEKYYPTVDMVIHSGMKRTIETAKLIYGDRIPMRQDERLKECDFGIFEGKNYQELSGNVEYQKWIDSNGTLPFPQGEAVEDFKKRCVDGFLECIRQYRECEKIAFCVHGGTIMAILSRLAEDSACNQLNGQGKGYYDYHCENGECVGYEVSREDIDCESRLMLTRLTSE